MDLFLSFLFFVVVVVVVVFISKKKKEEEKGTERQRAGPESPELLPTWKASVRDSSLKFWRMRGQARSSSSSQLWVRPSFHMVMQFFSDRLSIRYSSHRVIMPLICRVVAARSRCSAFSAHTTSLWTQSTS